LTKGCCEVDLVFAWLSVIESSHRPVNPCRNHHFRKDTLPLAGKTTFRSQLAAAAEAAAAAAAVVDPASIITAGLH